MKIKQMWLVTKPTKLSEMQDIFCKITVEGLRAQFLGGLQADEVYGLYTTEKEAREIAEWLLHLRDAEKGN